MSGLKWRPNDLFETYSTLRGSGPEVENHLIFYFWSTPSFYTQKDRDFLYN
ncbi:hypothetical protein [Globicatella sanguinis]